MNTAQAQPKSKAQVQAAVAQGVQASFGLNLKAMKLGPDGLQ